MIRNQSIEQILLEEGRVTSKILTEVREANPGHSKVTWRKLIDLGYVSESEVLGIISGRFNFPHLKRDEFPEEPFLIEEGSWPVKYLKENLVFPVSMKNSVLQVAMANPLDFALVDELRLSIDYEIQVCVSAEQDILEAIEKHYGGGATAVDRIIGDMAEDEVGVRSGTDDEDVDHLKDMASEAPVIKLVNLILSRAIETKASDIHVEPFEESVKVRYRVDGVLQETESLPKSLQAAVISRVKIMAKLNIAERRLPQDGRIRVRVLGKEIDLRVSTLPTLHGESLVMRILDRTAVILDLERLGFPERSLELFRSAIRKPYGMLLVTGPTGSGKTTTLYAALDEINTPEKKIITIEDPVEYQLYGINQIHVKPQIGLNFANGLRSIVRQDPDVIMVGEIRDIETADVAIQAALTGHMVFSTLHTNDSAGAITRLLDMGIENYLISSSLVAILAQRLVRILCPQCRKGVVPDSNVIREMGIQENGRGTLIYQSAGCGECQSSGYRGRLGIYEYLHLEDDIRTLILEKASANIIKDRARKIGLFTLREDGWDKVKQGITSIEEVLRVTLEEEAQ